MTFELPPPTIPTLHSDNYIDLDELGAADLNTYVPQFTPGDAFWPRWWGCGAQGQAVDFVDTLIEVRNPEPEGMPVTIANDLLRRLDQGWVFYSYQMEDTSQPDARGEESQRRFFYVGKRSALTAALAVPQCKESHDLSLDPDVLSTVSKVLIITLPYRAMQARDKVTLRLRRFFAGDTEFTPVTLSKTLIESDVGQPLQWGITSSEFAILDEGDYVLMSYRIEYADPTSATESAEQRLNIVKPATPVLPALSIKDFTGGGELDPDAYPDGITVKIPLYPDIQVGDDVVLYASADSIEVKTLRVDPSTITSQVLQFTLGYDWLAANNGKPLELVYQYARVGRAGTSQAFSVTLRKPLNLPPPMVEGATAIDDPNDPPDTYRGYIYAGSATNGVTIQVPDEAAIGADDRVQMHWEGVGSTGSHIADPTLGNSKRFFIPKAAVPANMNHQVKVYYRVTVPGQPPRDSKHFDLDVRGIDSGWPTIQFQIPTAPNGMLSLDQVPSTGVILRLGSWTYIAEGQRVHISARGLLQVGGEETCNMRVGAAEQVTEDEYYAGTLSVTLPKDFLERLAINSQLRISVKTSFDDGLTYISFPYVDVTLVT